jgi:hypothetical protein
MFGGAISEAIGHWAAASADDSGQNFTPVAASSAVPADLRRKLSKTKITPALATAAPPADVKQSDNAAAVRKNKRVQLER